MTKKTIRIIALIAFVELAIGISTIIGLLTSASLHLSKKPANVFIFVILSAMISTAIGIGLFKCREWARTAIVFFSGYIILTKVLVFAGLMHFNGEIIAFIPTDLKNYISIAYHAFLFIFFSRKSAKIHF